MTWALNPSRLRPRSSGRVGKCQETPADFSLAALISRIQSSGLSRVLTFPVWHFHWLRTHVSLGGLDHGPGPPVASLTIVGCLSSRGAGMRACVRAVLSFDGVAWPPARSANDNFLWSGCNGLASAPVALLLFAHGAGSVWGCVYFAAGVMMDRELRGWWQSRSCWHINVYLHRG